MGLLTTLDTLNEMGMSEFNHTFGWAIEAAKRGKKVARSGWNGKNMYIYMIKGRRNLEDLGFDISGGTNLPDVNHPSTQDGVSIGLFDHSEDEGAPIVMPAWAMRTASGALVIGWLASQTDMFAHDWAVVE